MNNDFEDIQKNNEIIKELYKGQEDEESFPKEEEKESKPSFEDGGFYLRFLQETNSNEKLGFIPRETSFSKRFYESSAQCNYDKVKWKAISEMEREVMCSILEIKLSNFKKTFFRIFSMHVFLY